MATWLKVYVWSGIGVGIAGLLVVLFWPSGVEKWIGGFVGVATGMFVCGVVYQAYIGYFTPIGQLWDAAEKEEANIRITRGNRNKLKTDLLAIVREAAKDERETLVATGGPMPTPLFTTSYPQRFPELKANAHYGRALDNLERVEAALKEQIFKRNEMGNRYNELLSDRQFQILFPHQTEFRKLAHVVDYD